MNTHPFHVAFAGGGTAGHLFPGLAVAKQLAARTDAPQITFVVSGKPLENSLVTKAGFDYLTLPSAPLAGSVRGILRFVGENFSGYREARRFIRKENVNLVVGLGGYASVPLCRAAATAGIPLVLLEQNVFPGKATRWLAPRADLICAAFNETGRFLQFPAPIHVTGNPIRAGFRPRRHPFKQRSMAASWQRRLIVLGGSGGAQSLNEFVPKALYKLRDRLPGWQIVHQTGVRDVKFAQELYRKFGLKAVVVPFVQNLSSVLRHADLAVCRAGGTTLAELAATGVPAVLVPYPHAADDHQRLNAEVFQSGGAAQLLDEREINVRLDDALVSVLEPLLFDSARRSQMSAAMVRLSQCEAAWRVAELVYQLACQSLPRKVA